MYSTIITGRPTTIRHQSPQPTGVGVHPVAAGAFNVDSARTLADGQKALNGGSYSIPIQINSNIENGNDLNGYEIPNFIHKKEKKLSEKESEGSAIKENSKDPAVFLKDNMMKDISEFTAQFDNTRDKADRINTCNLLYFIKIHNKNIKW